jgi:hypothetical protein
MQNETTAYPEEPKSTGTVQDMIYEVIREDLEVVTKMTEKAKSAKTRYAAKYYGKKAAKAKGKAINALRFAERFSKVKAASELALEAPAE